MKLILARNKPHNIKGSPAPWSLRDWASTESSQPSFVQVSHLGNVGNARKLNTFDGADSTGRRNELGDPALLRGRRAADQTLVDVGLTHPGSHALEAVAELIGDPLDGPVTRAELVAQRPHEADGLRLLLGALAPTLR